MYPRYGVLLGPLTQETLQTIHPRTLFMSVAGINNGALYNQNQLLVEAELQMMRQAQQVVLLADSSKFGQQALARLAALDEIDVVVTDAEISAEHRSAIRSAGCRLVIAQ
jgi:DeoR/GlpR family transcriptional regulator of sugar metabolism